MYDVARTRVPLRGSFVSGTEMESLFEKLDIDNQMHYMYWFDLVRQVVDENEKEVLHREKVERLLAEELKRREIEFFERVMAEDLERGKAEKEER